MHVWKTDVETLMAKTINWDFLEKYIPRLELMALKEHAEGEEKKHFVELLDHVEKQIKSMPKIYANSEKEAKDITIGMHYFGGATVYWIYELDQDTLEGYGFVCLFGMYENAELGYVYIPEILQIPFIELDLYWDDKKTLLPIMEKIQKIAEGAY